MTKFYVNPRHPEPQACCDRCGFNYLHSQLSWQHEYVGRSLVNLHLLVCKTCLDVPNPQLQTVILAPDPVPIRDPRPDPSEGQIGNPLTTESGATLTTEGGDSLLTENGA